MDQVIARGFLYRLLDAEQKRRLQGVEAKLPQGRCLQGFEICRLFNLKVDPRTPEEMQGMEQTAAAYSRVLWKDRILDYREENPNLTNQELTEAVDGEIGADDMAGWQEYADTHYKPSDTVSVGRAEFY